MSKIHWIKLSIAYGRQKIGIKQLKNSKAFIDYSQTIDDIYENLTKKESF